MFDTPVAQITLDDVLRFCRTFEEGVRVEYKREPQQITKVVSSLANSVGGIWVIGVETDPATNRAKQPITGTDKTGIEESVIQASQTGIYPALTPAVKTLPLPAQPGRVVAVVKVAESVEAPHAIENSTRVYIRTGSVAQPYELADLDRIEYLLKRRVEPERRREEIIAQMAARSPYRNAAAKVRVVVAPLYPRGLLLPMEELAARAEDLGARGDVRQLRVFRLTANGVLSTTTVPGRTMYHFEADTHGVVFFEEEGRATGEVTDRRTNETIPFIGAPHLVQPLGLVLNIALALFRGAITNVHVRYELLGYEGTAWLEHPPERLIDAGWAASERRCIGDQVTGATTATFETLPEERVPVVTEVFRQILYAFNYRSADLVQLVNAAMKGQGLV